MQSTLLIMLRCVDVRRDDAALKVYVSPSVIGCSVLMTVKTPTELFTKLVLPFRTVPKKSDHATPGLGNHRGATATRAPPLSWTLTRPLPALELMLQVYWPASLGLTLLSSREALPASRASGNSCVRPLNCGAWSRRDGAPALYRYTEPVRPVFSQETAMFVNLAGLASEFSKQLSSWSSPRLAMGVTSLLFTSDNCPVLPEKDKAKMRMMAAPNMMMRKMICPRVAMVAGPIPRRRGRGPVYGISSGAAPPCRLRSHRAPL
ncbi:hypothetical protein EYF80_053837 [Liparis tanakae]|uniref:Uncharacterized protein n=1 Tax=Liparis tanakae TaxID=230148 RepID=A0A4Z2F4H7_9TELE|nr:hypothetical protein EYF80_053837 [Liparis tanakae]